MGQGKRLLGSPTRRNVPAGPLLFDSPRLTPGNESMGSVELPRPKTLARCLRVAVIYGLVLGPCALPALARARPETIRAEVSYYSDELVENGPVRDIGSERNYEEVFKLYTYYEVLYDQDERVIRCFEYKRGEVIRTDRYRYAEDGSLSEHVIEVPGEPAKTIPLPGSK
jgi:hypothetical protein